MAAASNFTNYTFPTGALPETSQFPGVTGYLGPGLLATFIQGIELGVLIKHSTEFWSHSHSEKRWVKLIVAYVSVLAVCVSSCSIVILSPHISRSFSTAISFADTWTSTMRDFTDMVSMSPTICLSNAEGIAIVGSVDSKMA